MIESGVPVDPSDLELLRAEEPAEATTRARVRAKLAGVIPMGSVVDGRPSGIHPPRELAPPAPSAGIAKGPALAAFAFVIGGVTGAALYAVLVKPPPAQVVYVDRSTAPLAAPPPPLPVESVAETSPRLVASATRAVPHPSSSTRNSGSQLSAERIMLDEARAALMEGNTSRALALIDRHRRNFANALLAEERDALEVQSLVKAHRFDEARARADAFRKRTPGSLFLSVVDAAVESIP